MKNINQLILKEHLFIESLCSDQVLAFISAGQLPPSRSGRSNEQRVEIFALTSVLCSFLLSPLLSDNRINTKQVLNFKAANSLRRRRRQMHCVAAQR